ncbi:MAG TPA: hypothetical protein DCY55_10185 [Gammaproteobacteria bacterium]|nr:hypothetical protein [Gammaproteobacteria bacterium]
MASAGLSIDKASFDGDGDILQAPDGTIWLTFDDNAAGAGIRVDQLTPNADVTLTALSTTVIPLVAIPILLYWIQAKLHLPISGISRQLKQRQTSIQLWKDQTWPRN